MRGVCLHRHANGHQCHAKEDIANQDVEQARRDANNAEAEGGFRLGEKLGHVRVSVFR